MPTMIDPDKITGFDEHDGHARENEKHDVSIAEAVLVFFNDPLSLPEDAQHSLTFDSAPFPDARSR